MKEFITLIAFAALFFCLSVLTAKIGTTPQNTQTAVATIDRLTHHDGEVIYYVSFMVDGKRVEGKSVGYSSYTKPYDPGTQVSVRYYYTKAGWPRVMIQDQELDDGSHAASAISKGLRWIAMGFLAAAAFFLVKGFL